jgi:hypothetical protein
VQLTDRQQAAIDNAQRAMRETLKAAYPEDFPMLLVVAVTGMFAGLVHGELGRQLMTIINTELKPANLALMRRTGIGSAGHPRHQGQIVIS